MNLLSHNVKIVNPSHGTVLSETFVDPIQFKIFLKCINGCLSTKENLTFFNGEDFLLHVPYEILVNSIISTNLEPYSLSDHLIKKSKLEQKV